MGQYYDVATVKERGKPILRYMAPNQREYLHFNHKLVAVMSNGVRERAADITDRREHWAHWEVFQLGGVLSFDVYDFDPSNEGGASA